MKSPNRFSHSNPTMRVLTLIDKHYAGHDLARQALIMHSRQVAELAVTIARRERELVRSVDVDFVEEAAWLHDIGMLQTRIPEFGCNGSASYMAHGILGANLLRGEGLPRHALVCERHIGVGLSVDDIRRQGLPLPLRDMRPQTVEEEIIAYADLYFSKKKDQMKTVVEVRNSLLCHGGNKATIFDAWFARFGLAGA
jgi:uncharacterized protein